MDVRSLFLVTFLLIVCTACVANLPIIDSEDAPSKDNPIVTEPITQPKGSSAIINQKVAEQNLDVQPGCHTFALQPCGFITVAGTAAEVDSLKVALVKEGYKDATDYDTLRKSTKLLDSPPTQMNDVLVSAGLWSTTFRNAAGTYRVFVYDDSKKLLTQGEVIVKE